MEALPSTPPLPSWTICLAAAHNSVKKWWVWDLEVRRRRLSTHDKPVNTVGCKT